MKEEVETAHGKEGEIGGGGGDCTQEGRRDRTRMGEEVETAHGKEGDITREWRKRWRLHMGKRRDCTRMKLRTG